MKVPLLDLKEQNAALEPEFKAAFERVLQSGYYISGPEIRAFEEAAAAYTQTGHAIAVSSGSDALLVALMALDIGPGDEVICPSFTFFATAGSVVRLGAKPIFAEVCPHTFNLRAQDIQPLLTERTRAIIPVHLFGQMAEMDHILQLAAPRNIAVIEDAAQALGSRNADRPAGSLGTCGTFSFFPSKNLSGFGEGGLVTTNDDALAHKIRLLRNHGMEPRYFHSLVGGNFRLDELQGALLRIKLPHLDTWVENRRSNAEFYRQNLANLAPEHLILPTVLETSHHIWNQFTLRIQHGKRDALREFLQTQDIASEIYYPIPLHAQECFADLSNGKTFPVTNQLAAEVLSIPIFPELKPEQLARVVQALRKFFAC